MVGLLIQATVGILGGAGRRLQNRRGAGGVGGVERGGAGGMDGAGGAVASGAQMCPGWSPPRAGRSDAPARRDAYAVARRRVRPVAAADLALLTTRRLLAYRARLLALEASAEVSDLAADELPRLDDRFIHFKDDARWVSLYNVVKVILAEREHIR